MQVADGIAFLRAYPFTGGELVYCDPPYLHETRSRTDLYRFEMTDAQHLSLLETVRALPCLVMISGYWSPLYAAALEGWNRASFQTITRGGRLATDGCGAIIPSRWPCIITRYLGEDFREREHIKRKKQRWVHRLHSMPILERRALLSAIEEVWQPRSSPDMTIPARHRREQRCGRTLQFLSSSSHHRK